MDQDEVIDSMYDEIERLQAALEFANFVADDQRAKNAKLREALEKIANEDYRGNRPQSAVIAYEALAEQEE